MVRLYYLAVIQKSQDKNIVLCEASNLSDFSFFRRNGAKEFMRFSCCVLTGRTDPDSKVSVQEQMYVCHVNVKTDNLAAAAVTDDEYPHAAAHICLEDLLSDFIHNQRSKSKPTTDISDFINKYREPASLGRLDSVRQKLDETKIILHRTIESVLRRGENIDDLVSKTDELSVQAKTFFKTARKTNACCHAF